MNRKILSFNVKKRSCDWLLLFTSKAYVILSIEPAIVQNVNCQIVFHLAEKEIKAC